MREIEEASKKDCSSLVTSMKTYKIEEGSNKEFFCSSLKQQTVGRYVAPLGHIILIPSQ